MKTNYFTYLILVIFLLGCETVVDIVIPVEAPLLVINSTLIDGEYISVNVSESRHILDENAIVYVGGAKVDIYQEGILLTTLPDSLDGNYISASFKSRKGEMYDMVISKNGFETVYAEVRVPFDTGVILSVVLDTIPTEPDYYYPERLRFRVDIEDDKKIKNYYEIAVYSGSYYDRYDYNADPPIFIDSVYTFQPMFIESKDPTLEEYQSFGTGIIFNDELFNGKAYTLNLLADLGYYFGIDEDDIKPRTYYVVLRNTSESYYNYGMSAKNQLWNNGNPFAQPVTVYNNIENGFGVFSAFNSTIFEVEQ